MEIPDKNIEHEKNVNDALSCLKKAQKESDLAQTNSLELQAIVAKAKKGETREKDLEKVIESCPITDRQLIVKHNIAVEKSLHAAETLRVHEEIARNAKDHYIKEVRPEIHHELKTKEKERCEYTKNILKDYINLERLVLERQLQVVDALCDKITAVDVAEDVDNFISSCLNDDLDNGQDKSVRGLVDPARRGRMLLKTGESGSAWRSKYLVLMPEGNFYIFDQEDAPKPKKIIELQACSIHYVHESYFDQPFCFQMLVNYAKVAPKASQDTASTETAPTVLREAFNFAAESERDRETWIYSLRHFIPCCAKCSVMYGSKFSALNELQVQGIEPINEQYREIRSMKITIVEAKEIPQLPGVKTLNPYSVVMFDDVNCAMTGIKSGDSPLWGEEFELE